MKTRIMAVSLMALLVCVLPTMAQTTIAPTSAPVVLSPNGGEQWANGSTQMIVWTWNGTVKPRMFQILLSTDGGRTYPITIAPDLPGDAMQYKWQVKAPESSAALIKVIGQIPVDNPLLPALQSVEDVSDRPFSIVTNPPPIEAPPAVTVVAPNGGEIWQVGSTQVVSWKFSGMTIPSSYSLLLSSDGGKTYNAIAERLSTASTEYKWMVKAPDSKMSMIKVAANFSTGTVSSIEDASNAPFTILTKVQDPPPVPIQSLVVLSPKANEVWMNGTTHEIVWKRLEGMPEPKIYTVMLTTDESRGYSVTVAKEIPGSQTSVKWVVNAPVSKTARVKVIAYTLDRTMEAVSDGTFVITAAKNAATSIK